MKRKNSDSELVTKGYFKEELGKLEIRIDIKLDKLEQKVDDRARQYRDEILTSNDKLAKTLETIREDLEIGNFQTEEKIKNHEKRISQLEKLQQTA